MKKVLSVLFIVFTAFVLIACGKNNEHKVSGNELTNVADIELAIDKLASAGGESVIGDAFSVEVDVAFTEKEDGVTLGSFDFTGSVFMQVAELLNDFKLHAELDVTATFEGLNINGDAGLYITNGKLYSTGLATSQLLIPTNVSLSELGLTTADYNELIDTIKNPENVGENPDFEIPVDFAEIMDLLIEHNIVTVFEHGDKLSFVIDVNLEKLNQISLELGDETYNSDIARKMDFKFTIILVNNAITFLDIEADLDFDTISYDGKFNDDFEWIQTEVINTIILNARLTFKNNAKMPAFPNNLEN